MAASCAAILAVYAAGYWRTRDEARRFESQAQSRRSVRPAPVSPRPSAVAAPAPASTAPETVSLKVETAELKPAPRLVILPEPATPAPVVPLPEKPSSPSPVAQSETTDSTSLPSAVEATAAEPEPPPGVVWRDGVYTGWGRSFHGDIEARVVIRDGKIRTSEIATCATRYPCYVIETIFNQPVERQSPDVDRVSRATESADAYSDAVWEALQKAEQAPETASPGPASLP